MQTLISLTRITLILMILFSTSACNQELSLAAEPTVEDLRIARRAMDVSEIRIMLGGGVSQTAIIAEVNQRHLARKIDASTEVALTERGAGQALIAALKDSENQLTKNQMVAYRQIATNSTLSNPGPNRSPISSSGSALTEQEKERARQLNLQQQGFQLAEKRRAEQAAQESRHRQDVEATWRGIKSQNASRRTYGRTVGSSSGYYDSNGRFIPYHR